MGGRYDFFFFLLLSNSVRNSVLLMCIITAINVEVLDTEQRDY